MYLIFRISCRDVSSTSFICGLAGVATIGLVSALHLLFLRTMKLVLEDRQSKKHMKGVVIRSYKGVSSIEVRTNLPIPKILSEDEILIKVVAAGIDTMDLMIAWGYGRSLRSYIRQNNQHSKDPSMTIVGRECSGIVLDTGNDVTSISRGDKVWAVSAYYMEGLMAEYAVVKENQVTLKPRNLSFEEAACLPYTSIKVCNVMYQASLNSKTTKDKRILVITGNSPVGLFAIQLLKSWGGHITTTVPTAGLPMCHMLDADDVVVYTVSNFEDELRKRKRFDIVINTVGTTIHELCVDISSCGGTVVSFTTTPILSDKYEVIGPFLSLGFQILAWIRKVKGGMLTTFWWDNFSYDKKYLMKTATLVEEEKIRPVIEGIYDIDDAAIAFGQLAKYENVGKNVFRIFYHES